MATKIRGSSLAEEFQNHYYFEFWEKHMSKYDLTFLLNEESELKTLKELVASLDCKIVKEEKWGEKTLAYPIRTSQAVYYNAP